MSYRGKLDRKKQVLLDNPFEVIQIRENGESQYIKDLFTERIYLRNCTWIEPSEFSKNEIYWAKNLKIFSDRITSHQR